MSDHPNSASTPDGDASPASDSSAPIEETIDPDAAAHLINVAEATSDGPATVFIKPRKSRPFLLGHPWVFSGSIRNIKGNPVTGDEVVVRTSEGEYIAHGLFNPNSNIRVRLYDHAPDSTSDVVTEGLLQSRIDRALSRRAAFFDLSSPRSACRLVFSESDGLSGLTVDRYGEYLLVMLTSAALQPRFDVITRLLVERLSPKGIWLRTEKGLRDREGLDISDGLIFGEEPPECIVIEENGLEIGIDLQRGQKTGFYLDQSANRQRFTDLLRALSPDRSPRVLDLFSYSGGFSLAALRAGAEDVTAVDASATALELAEQNAERNGFAGRFKTVKADVFPLLDGLIERGEQYDAIVLDPPKMARHRAGRDQAIKGYARLNGNAMSLLKEGGLLVTCSCSGLVDREEFLAVVRDACHPDHRIRFLSVTGADVDHPFDPVIPESDYLTCAFARVEHGRW